jgi:acetyl esterase/lipase
MNRRVLIKRAIALAAVQPAFPFQASAREGDDADLLANVHAELRGAAVAALEEMRSVPRLSLRTLPEIRRLYATYGSQPAADIPFEKRVVSGLAGQPSVTLYVINAAGEKGRPAILHIHGGGFVLGTARSAIPTLQTFARELDCVVVTVEYRLAPETTYKGSVEDNYAGLRWLHANATDLGVDKARIGVMGESSGGGHAALLAIAARDRAEVPLAFQCLTYPMLDDRTGSSRAVPPSIGRLVWTATNNQLGWASFLGMTPGTTKIPSAAVPARVSNLQGLPPTFIAVGSIDLFVNEDIDYAQRLNNAGVNTELIVVPGAFHGFDLFPGASSVAKGFNEARLIALRRGLEIK